MQCQAVRREFEPIGPTMFKNPLGVTTSIVIFQFFFDYAFGKMNSYKCKLTSLVYKLI